MIDLPEDVRAAMNLAASQHLYAFTTYMFAMRKGFAWKEAHHHRLICEKLMQVYRGEIKRLIINIPPRYSKTEIAVINFIAWTLGRNPDSEFIHASYSGRLAANNSWQARELVQHETYRDIFPDVELRNDSQARDEWRTTAGGCVYAVGTGGTITGYGAGKHRDGFGGALLLDDLHKADEARSDIIREGVIEWFQNTLESRKNSPDTPIILIMQRLHERDIAGWLLEDGNGEHWDRLILEALDKNNNALWPAKHSSEELIRMRNASPYTFAGQYQQQPSTPEGNIFKPDMIEVVDALPVEADMVWVRGWDLAATVPKIGSDPDWTAGPKIGRHRVTGRFYIGDMTRLRGSPDEVVAALKSAAQRDGKRNTTIDLPQDPGQAGKSQVLYLTKELFGYKVTSSPESGDKVTRAEPFAAQVNVGNVSMLKAPWNDAFVSELRMFPNVAHDDQVDGCSRAFNKLTETPKGMKINKSVLRRK